MLALSVQRETTEREIETLTETKTTLQAANDTKSGFVDMGQPKGVRVNGLPPVMRPSGKGVTISCQRSPDPQRKSDAYVPRSHESIP